MKTVIINHTSCVGKSIEITKVVNGLGNGVYTMTIDGVVFRSEEQIDTIIDEFKSFVDGELKFIKSSFLSLTKVEDGYW